MGKVSIRGQMERSMMENGKTEDNTAKEGSLILKEEVNLATGRMVKERNGLKEMVLIHFTPINLPIKVNSILSKKIVSKMK